MPTPQQTRTGLVAQKVGMTRLFNGDGDQVPVTVLKIDGCQVIAQRTAAIDGYTALQIGVGKAKVKNVSKAMRGHFAKAKIEPRKKVIEFRVSADALVDVGAELTADHFAPGQQVDVTGVSIGKGFAGGMKRWNFGGAAGDPRRFGLAPQPGIDGNRQDPGRTFPGKKMAGHLGAEQVTTLNLKIIQVDAELGLIMVKGCVPGSDGGWVLVRDAVKRPRHKDTPFPAGIRAARVEDAVAEASPAAEAPAEAPAATESEG